jgi:hypothetical protein
MHYRFIVLVVSLAAALRGAETVPAQGAVTERAGFRRISSKPFPVAENSQAIPMMDNDFENQGKHLPGWGHGQDEIVSSADAPQGQAYFRMKVKKGAGLNSPKISGQPGGYYFLSFWLKAPVEPWGTLSFTSDEREPSFTHVHTLLHYPVVPASTWAEWRQVGFYFMLPPQCQTMQLSLSTREEGAEGQFINLDDIKLRTVSATEMAAAYQAERANLPPYDVTPRPGDGKNLALSVEKWEGRAGIPGKPFVVWALGSSFTDWQGSGYELMEAIRQRFPKAPQIIYRKHGGPGTPWEYVHGWIKQFVAVEEPDLIFTYTSGTLEGLDAMLTEIRQHTTAEVIVPSLHFKPDSKMTPDDIEHGAGVPWDKVREICQRHGAEFVENRREIAEYIAHVGLNPDDLLHDHNHQNVHGRIRIWDNVSRHLVKSDQSEYTPETRERRISVTQPKESATEKLAISDGWSVESGVLHSGAKGARIKLSFTGNRVDVIGRKAPGGGTVKVFLDGRPASEAPVFFMNCIQPDKKNWRIPHAVDLGNGVTPQKWTIHMTSDTGDYEIAGSVTGADGTGNLAQPFRSLSGQIGIDPKFWRAGRVEKPGQPVEYGVAKGDSFSFDVFRGVAEALNFNDAQAGDFHAPAVRNLPNGKHILELVTTGDGEVLIESFYVYQPPEQK